MSNRRYVAILAAASLTFLAGCSDEAELRMGSPHSSVAEPRAGRAPLSAAGAGAALPGSRPPGSAQPAGTVPIMPDPERKSCGGDSYMTEPKNQLELVVLFDNSASMAIPRIDELISSGAIALPWDLAVSELTMFVRDAASVGLSISLKYFGAECNADFYARPDVPMGKLPAHADPIANSLLATLPISDTATLPALQGGLRHARERAAASPDARVVILLVTDGAPDPEDCPGNETQAVANVAADGFKGTPSIPTYVLATAPGLDIDQIAQAGGTRAALLADLGSAGQLVRVMNDVRGRELAALPCEYGLPAEYAKYDDPKLVNLTHDGKAIGRVESAAKCDAMRGGWYYDVLPNPTQIHACERTCEQLKRGGSVEVQLGCPGIELGPQ